MGILSVTGVVSRAGGGGQIGSVAGQETGSYGSAVTASMAGSGAPTINIGGEGRVAPGKQAEASGGEESFSKQVGKIIDESRSGQAGDTVDDGQSAEEGNPKKRMWDAEKEASQEPRGEKAEL